MPVVAQGHKVLFYRKDKANERSGYMMVSDHRRPLPRATPEELQVRGRPLRGWAPEPGII